ncbi:hypothetical protein CBR_g3326 [Chara braunii]|uniref:Uncharacterized protein n=1 Tax=Chara braunii TaxID=69332 RepID=A0A388KFK4_CHABU|nr:hypothetical protein CBR_g3326 [Chara braunii]|eukprot:GBG68786.1 hypothetical protein CBR_g3326 [Chara braunii]
MDVGKWAEWWHAYVALSLCLLEMVFHWAEPTDKEEEDEVPNDEMKLLIVQAWRMDTEGELLGILFGKVRDGHLEPITSKVLVFPSQLLDDLPLEILSRCDERSAPATLPRTLASQLLWSTCTELDGDNIYLPSSSDYLVIDVTDITLWDPIIRRAEVGAEEEVDEEKEEREDPNKEEESEASSDDPDYHESEEDGSEESGLDESGSCGERSKEEDEAAAKRGQERAEWKRPVQDSDVWLLQDDPAHRPEPPQEVSGEDGVATMEGSGSRRSRSRRRRRSPTSAQSPPPQRLTIRLCGDAVT